MEVLLHAAPEKLNRLVWGAPMLLLILGVGVYLSVRTGFAQLRLFPRAMGRFFRILNQDNRSDGVSSFQALCTALAATVGTGNLVGVAGAICLGGPGSIFWMWISAILGMMTKFAEATLALRYRKKAGGEILGGPMYLIDQGLGGKWKVLSAAYALFGMFAAFGVGNATQINAMLTGIEEAAGFFGGGLSRQGRLLLAAVLAAAVGVLLCGGAKRIGAAAEVLVPFVSCGYIVLCAVILFLRFDTVFDAFSRILQGAFSPRAVTGGVVGSAFQTLRVGISRGVFTNEAGMGTASIAHAGAHVRHPPEQGLMGIVEVFLDTIVICTLTALVILVSGVPIPYAVDSGSALTVAAFSAVLGPWVSVFLALALCCFAFATILGWGLYGMRCAQYLFGTESRRWFALVQALVVIVSAMLQTGVIWSVSEVMNGLMAVPNLIALLGLCPELVRLTLEYESNCGNHAAGGTYENFNQCKPLSALSHAKVSSLCAGGKKTG